MDFVVAAAALRLEFERRLELFRSQQAGGGADFTVYAVDSDVVKLFSSPSTVGPPGRKPHEGGYGNVFPGDDETSATAIATLLAEHIFYSLSDYPVLQLPTHSAESSQILSGIIRDLSRPAIDRDKTFSQLYETEWKLLVGDVVKKDADEIERLAELLSRFKTLPEDDYHVFSSYALSVLLLKEHELQNELVRFLKLFADQRMIPTNGFSRVLQRTKETRELAELFRDPTTISDWFFLSERTEFWKDALLEHKSSAASEEQVDRDANALANLEFINRNLKPASGKLVLISGDHALHEAFKSGAPDDIATCLLHPRAFLIEALESNTDALGDKRYFRKSLEALLMTYTGTISVDNRELEKIAARQRKTIRVLEERIADSENGNAPLYLGAFNEWQDQKAQVVTSKLLSIDSSRDLIVSLISGLKTKSQSDIETDLRHFREQLELDNIKQWSELSLSFSKAGIGILFALRGSREGEDRRPRNPPPMIFDQFEHTHFFVKRVLETNRVEDLSPSLDEMIEKIGLDVSNSEMDQRHQHYLTYLAIAVLCAAEGRWYISQVLAEKALELGDSIFSENNDDPISGREALFVASQAVRMSAKQISDVDRSEALLKEAEARFEVEKKRNSTNRRNELTFLKAVRFECEKVSIRLSKFHFFQWENEGSFDEAEIEGIADGIEKTLNLLDDNLLKNSTTSQYRELLGCYLFINAAQLLHLATKQGADFQPNFKQVLEELWSKFGESMDNLETPLFHVTYLMRSYKILFEKMHLGRFNKRIAQGLLSPRNIEKYSVLKYDKKRFSDLAKMVLQ